MILFESPEKVYNLKPKRSYKSWLKEVAASEKFEIGELTYVFLSDEDLLEMNINYLDHYTYTDIITFDNSEEEDLIEGDIFISIDRVKENAEKFKVSFEQELRRVLAHGLLHLCGYKDKTDEESTKMRQMEDKALDLWENQSGK